MADFEPQRPNRGNLMDVRPATPAELAREAANVPAPSADLLADLTPEERERLRELHGEGAEPEVLDGAAEQIEAAESDDTTPDEPEERETPGLDRLMSEPSVLEPEVVLMDGEAARSYDLLHVAREGKRTTFTWRETLRAPGVLAYATYVTEAEYQPLKVNNAVVRDAAGAWKRISGPACPFLQAEPGTYNIADTGA
jgi:hypothetical protein